MLKKEQALKGTKVQIKRGLYKGLTGTIAAKSDYKGEVHDLVDDSETLLSVPDPNTGELHTSVLVWFDAKDLDALSQKLDMVQPIEARLPKGILLEYLELIA